MSTFLICVLLLRPHSMPSTTIVASFEPSTLTASAPVVGFGSGFGSGSGFFGSSGFGGATGSCGGATATGSLVSLPASETAAKPPAPASSTAMPAIHQRHDE